MIDIPVARAWWLLILVALIACDNPGSDPSAGFTSGARAGNPLVGRWIRHNLHPRLSRERNQVAFTADGRVAMHECISTYELLPGDRLRIGWGACRGQRLPGGTFAYALDAEGLLTLSQSYLVEQMGRGDAVSRWVAGDRRHTLSLAGDGTIDIGTHCRGRYEGWPNASTFILIGWIRCQGGLSPVYPDYYGLSIRDEQAILSQVFARIN